MNTVKSSSKKRSLWRVWLFALILAMLSALLTFSINFRADLFSKNALAFFPLLEKKISDTKFRFRGRVVVEPQVVIAAGDEATFADPNFGVWGSWDRQVFAQIIDNLIKAGANVVGLDMVFTDLKGFSPKNSATLVQELENLQKIRAQLLDPNNPNSNLIKNVELEAAQHRIEEEINIAAQGNKALIDIFDRHSNRIVQGMILNPQASEQNFSEKTLKSWHQLQENRFEDIEDFAYAFYGTKLLQEQQDGDGESLTLRLNHHKSVADLRFVEEIEGEFIIPLEDYMDSAEYLGFFNAAPDDDGVMRSLPLVFRYKDKLFPSLSLSVASLALGGNPLFLAHPFNPEALSQIVLPLENGQKIDIPVDLRGQMRLNYLGPSKEFQAGKDLQKDQNIKDQGVFRRISLKDIRSNNFDKSLVKDKVVLIAVTAIGSYDQRVTPFTAVAPGVEMHATAIQNLLDGNTLLRPIQFSQYEIIAAFLLALLLVITLTRFGALAGLALSFVLSFGWLLVDFEFLFKQNYLFHQVPLQLQLWTTWAGILVHSYLSEGREKALLKKEFSTVLAPTVVEQLLKNPDLQGLGGDERQMSVMFSDIRGFTSISENMTPQELTSFLNEYLTPMTNILIENLGTLDKYMGDAIMAFWGAPIKHKDHAKQACQTALDMIACLNKLQIKWKAEGKPFLEIGIGINTGLMRVGFMGSERMRSYTLLGDQVNLGARLEGINKQYATHIIISEYTYEEVKTDFYGRLLDNVRVKGKNEPVKIYELRGSGKAFSEEQLFIDDFEHAFSIYEQKNFQIAQILFKELFEAHGDLTSEIHMKRCAEYILKPPPEDWDGVYTMTSK